MMASKENAAALPSRVDPSPLREYFSTCCSWEQITLSTLETPVKKGLWTNYYKTALLSHLALQSQMRAVKAYFVLDAEQSIKYHSGDFCGRSRHGELSPH